MRILIVDDSRAALAVVERTLRIVGFADCEIVKAQSATDALKAVADQMPDLVLCDINMPVVSGFGFLRAFRERGGKVPVGILTSDSSPTVRDQALKAGAAFVATKPFTVDSLGRALAPYVPNKP
jgi:two-component system chemotaxis response regulator CheY